MKAADVLDFYNQLTDRGIKTWLDGGWAVDALLGEETRSHEDVDIVIAQKDVPKLRDLLVTQGYKDVLRDDTSAWNFVLGDDKGHRIDVHVIVIDDKGNGMYGPIKKGEVYPAASLTGMGTISGHPVKCISAEYLVKFHAGYELDDNDRKDIAALCKQFGIEYPQALINWKIMGSFLEFNDTLQLTKEQGFPAGLDLERHLVHPYTLAEVEDRVFPFRDKPNVRAFQMPPVRNFLVENRNGKWICWGLCHILEVTHDYVKLGRREPAILFLIWLTRKKSSRPCPCLP